MASDEAPELVIYRVRGDNSNWVVYNTDFWCCTSSRDCSSKLTLKHCRSFQHSCWYVQRESDNDKYLAEVSDNTSVNSTTPMVAYCWHSVENYSAVGTYVGNGSTTDGPFIYTGHSVAWVMTKSTEHQEADDT